MLGLEDNRPRIEAQRILERAERGDVELTFEGWLQFSLLAGRSQDEAEAAAAQAEFRRLRRAARED